MATFQIAAFHASSTSWACQLTTMDCEHTPGDFFSQRDEKPNYTTITHFYT